MSSLEYEYLAQIRMAELRAIRARDEWIRAQLGREPGTTDGRSIWKLALQSIADRLVEAGLALAGETGGDAWYEWRAGRRTDPEGAGDFR